MKMRYWSGRDDGQGGVRHERSGGSRGMGARMAVVIILLAAQAWAADPFYLGLLRRGTEAFNRHDFVSASRLLRVACFGLLDEPELLADGLTRLALTHAELGDTQAFGEVFARVQEVESRFGAYSRAPLAAEQRQAFEKAVVRLISQATLQADPAFARLIPRPEERLEKLLPRQRRAELEALVAREPGQVRWPLMLAELELAEGRSAQALRQAEAALKVAPGSSEAKRFRGLALASEKRWALALPDLEGLSGELRDARVQEAMLSCLIGLERWGDAVTFGTTLPAEVSGRPAVARQLREAGEEVQKQKARLARKASPTPKPTPVPSPAEMSPQAESPNFAPPSPRSESLMEPPTAPSPTRTTRPASRRETRPPSVATPTVTLAREAALSPEDSAVLEQAQELVRGGEFARAFGLAQQVADANPEVPEAQRLAGELAYRISRWAATVAYFRRAQSIPDGQPQRQFYHAVALFETGNKVQAAQELRRCLGFLERTPFVDDYVRRILGQ